SPAATKGSSQANWAASTSSAFEIQYSPATKLPKPKAQPVANAAVRRSQPSSSQLAAGKHRNRTGKILNGGNASADTAPKHTATAMRRHPASPASRAAARSSTVASVERAFAALAPAAGADYGCGAASGAGGRRREPRIPVPTSG